MKWTAARKKEIVEKYRKGEVTASELFDRHRITTEELNEWCASLDKHGTTGLKTTYTGILRRKEKL